ncbi:Transcriptional regulator, MarR family protein [Roseovarius sp. EC-HK134]|nr:Putative regulatory protein associated with the ectoine operon [Roseovarius sp. AK1035]EDM30196.1 transcriptional regulator, MarR family protein [Roseovarius sp. TM1035]VVT09487.1 Transcriptional regulator, MarR family protein [Roseovarius sp. EC-HK134]|tara:strand:- start:316 stop:852 length:537 start_codon:yes stop_codon:yes gene_type:complete
MKLQLSDSFATITAITKGARMDRTDQSLIALRRILRATEIYGRKLASAAGLTAVQFRVLQIVAERGNCTATHIAQQMRVSQATITALVDKLVKHGVVTREKSQTDRRQTNIVITDAGHETIRRAPDALQQRYVRKFEALADWEQAQLVASLERVATLLDAEDIDAAPVLDTSDFRTHS